MSVTNHNLGHATAYGYAKSKGYTGTEEEFAALMASYADVAEHAAQSAEEAAADALKSEGNATGTQNGTPVGSGSPYYHNNAKYYSEQASGSASAASGSASNAGEDALKAEGYALGKQNGQSVAEGSPYYHKNAAFFEMGAEACQSAALQASRNSEAWAVGEINHEPVGDRDLRYHNNSKYYSQQAAASAAASAAMTGLAPQFSALTDYAAGDYVIENGVLYQFTAAHAAGAWTGTDAVAAVMSDGVANLKSQIGELSDLETTDKSNLVAAINEAAQSGGGGDGAPPIICNASGDIASFSDGADDVPVKDLVVSIEPVQDLHGYDYPYPGGASINLIPDGTDTAKGYVAGRFLNTDGTETGNGTYYISEYFSVTTGETYTLTTTTSTNSAVCFYDSSYQYISGVQYNRTEPPTITAPTGAVYARSSQLNYSNANRLMFAQGSTAQTPVRYSNICPIEGWTGAKIARLAANLLNFDRTLGEPSNTASSGSTKRTFNLSEYIKGISASNSYSPSDITSCSLSGGVLKFVTTSVNYGIAFPMSLVPNTRYYFSRESASNITAVRVSFYAADGTPVRNFTLTNDAYFDVPYDIATTLLVFIGTNNVEATVTNPMISLVSGQSFVPYTPYANYEVDWTDEAGTVYGGSLDVTTGVLTPSWVYEDIKANVAQYSRMDTNTSGQYFYTRRISNLTAQTWSNLRPNQMFTSGQIANPYEYSIHGLTDVAIALPVTGGSTDIRVGSFGHNTLEDWTAYVASQDVMGFAFTITNPQTVQLSPVEVATLLGLNNIWADCGDVSVDYVADTKLYIEQLTEPDADMFADANIVSGQYFMVGNVLYLATANIANGAAVVPGTNCTRTNLAAALNAINS